MNNKYQTIFLATLLIVTIALSFFIFMPYLIPISLAAICGVLLYPVYLHVLKYVKSDSVSAAITIFLLILVVAIPVYFLANQIIVEAQGVYTRVAGGSDIAVDTISRQIETGVQKYYPGFTFNAKEYIGVVTGWIVNQLGGIFSGTVDLVLKGILGLIALFYFLKDGKYFKGKILELSPLADATDQLLVDSVKSAAHSILYGSVLVALIQGVFTGLGFFIFGVPNFVLWGTVAAFAALIPTLGTGVIAAPAILYLFFYGNPGMWIGQLIWSVVFVGLIDNLLSPILINKGMRVHPLFILFSILGGVQMFGPEGFLVGPLVLSILFALLRITRVKQV
jgi:predicted PurR-regulated permease PerM